MACLSFDKDYNNKPYFLININMPIQESPKSPDKSALLQSAEDAVNAFFETVSKLNTVHPSTQEEAYEMVEQLRDEFEARHLAADMACEEAKKAGCDEARLSALNNRMTIYFFSLDRAGGGM